MSSCHLHVVTRKTRIAISPKHALGHPKSFAICNSQTLAMSDDEIPTGAMEGMGMDGMDDMSDDDMGDMPAELPEGVKKEILTAAADGNWKMPKKGDEVTVHYVGTLQSDGSEFDSSRSRDKPFVFTLGRSEVIKGWDVGVATMKKGEVAKFTLAPEFAYGDAGSPPKIPEKATLVFEVELISWVSKDDLFGDEGVIKTQTVEGSGWRTPKSGDEVLVSIRAEASGSVLEEHADLEYEIGSDELGPLAKACDKALLQMKTGEEVQLKCSKDYALGDRTPEGAYVTIKLSQIYETKDVSFESDKSVMKKQVVQGEGYETPNEGGTVTLAVDVGTNGSEPLPGFSAKTLQFVVGNGEVCDALECAVASMKKGEKAILTVSKPALALEAQLGLTSLEKLEKVQLTLRLEDFEKAKETWNMNEEEKLEFGAARKEVGASLFKAGRFAMSLQRYKKVTDIFSFADNFKEENKAKAKELKKLCNLNKAACYLKTGDFFEAKGTCDAVLKEDSQNLKATFRRAQAHFGMKNFLDCIQDCKRVVELDAQNRDARLLLKKAQEGQKEEDKKSKGLFASMCKALGKGPIPPPHKEKRPYEDEDKDEDVDMEPAGKEGSSAPMEAEQCAQGGA